MKTFISERSCRSGTSPSHCPQSGVAEVELHEDTPLTSGIAELREGTFLNSVIAEANLARHSPLSSVADAELRPFLSLH